MARAQGHASARRTCPCPGAAGRYPPGVRAPGRRARMPYARRGWIGRLVLLGVAGVALLNGGCLAAAAVGAAGGGAAALYAYERGRLYRDYPAALADAAAAVRTSLAELQFPPSTEKG